MLTYFVIIPILIAVFLYLFSSAKSGRIIAIAVQLALVCFAYYLFTRARREEIITFVGEYDGVLGIILRADNLSAVFILLTAFIFLIAAIYSFNEANSRMFWFLLFIWEGALIALFLTRDFFNVFVAMEVANVVVTILIMYYRQKRSIYDGLIYLTTNIIAMQFYLLGIGYVYRITGVLDMEAAAYALVGVDRGQLVLPFALIITAVAFKCALMPLYSWLPKAHGTPGAPAAVSAVLSGLHIKAGLYLFLRVQDIFPAISTSRFFLIVGIITGIFGVVMATAQTDIKLILAYSTVAQIGLIMVGLNISDPYSYTGSLYHIINHALFKSALFLGSGVIMYAYGTRDTTKIRGVLRRMPIVGFATILAILGIVGAPFFNGSISKYFMMANLSWQLNAVMTFINLGTIVVFVKYSAILFGKCENMGDSIKPDKLQLGAIIVLGATCFAGGVFGPQLIGYLFGDSVRVDALGYLEKVVIFAVSLAAGYYLIKHYDRFSNTMARLRVIDLSFRGICFSIGIFFAVAILVTGIL